ncbi:hypothetical protein LCGC14_1604920, partial [marine sediment metagenome]
AGRCDVYTTDRSGLAAQRTKLKDPDAHVVLPEIISKEPLGPVVRHGDNKWGDIVRWSLNTMIIAEELGITSAKIKVPSAHLFEYDPVADKVYDRGGVVEALKACGVYREGEQQMKIHSRICQAGDGHLYFASMDEKGEDMAKGKVPIWGSHLWRYRIKPRRWEHLLRMPEGVITAGAGKRYVYALGYFDHKLYQYDTATSKVRSVVVGAPDGHISRNILIDRKDHVYVIRIKADPAGGLAIVTLVEFDPSLKEIGQSPIRRYIDGRPGWAHGIVSYAELPDGSIAFTGYRGHLTLVRPSATGPAKVINLGWFHPAGKAYAGSMFCDATGRYLMSVVWREYGDPREWVVYDLKTRTSSTAPFELTTPKDVSLVRTALYGSNTYDRQGDCYAVGRHPKGYYAGFEPFVLRITPPKAQRTRSAPKK